MLYTWVWGVLFEWCGAFMFICIQLFRMTYGVHQIDFWTRVVHNCVDEPCRETFCADIAVELSGYIKVFVNKCVYKYVCDV